MLAVAVGLVEGLGKAVGHQQGEIGVLALQGGVGIGVAVHRVDALHVLGHHVAIRVHAEGAHLVAVLLGPVDQLGLVHHVSDVLKDPGGQLHPYADVHLVVDEGDAQVLALVGEPLGAGAPGGGDKPVAGELSTSAEGQAVALIGGMDGLYGGMEPELDALLQVLIDILEDDQILFGPQMLDLGL